MNRSNIARGHTHVRGWTDRQRPRRVQATRPPARDAPVLARRETGQPSRSPRGDEPWAAESVYRRTDRPPRAGCPVRGCRMCAPAPACGMTRCPRGLGP